jgi:hypothetical protein
VINTPRLSAVLLRPRDVGRRAVEAPLLGSDRAERLPLDGIREAFAEGAEGAEAMLLCNPHNPTGYVPAGKSSSRRWSTSPQCVTIARVQPVVTSVAAFAEPARHGIMPIALEQVFLEWAVKIEPSILGLREGAAHGAAIPLPNWFQIAPPRPREGGSARRRRLYAGVSSMGGDGLEPPTSCL